ncbi:hypothetical protein BAUCODRAFT_127465 [Baudoinia panamericana UAMH 10762]|uniref:Uncharacterized protein n=1 Tax=Baudoinia panamericana (strain UAMH 10762) TaxID=717646 RepID=M2M352_BAUPA|nr:uncharacterized protein BAUCODRAFT_127465 [Baudoinia panamericana UAMH 10762]EMC90966.1 hypothetical protein BAUCODRAFT_127465 [Baudoinia panamericana UAMH 10762]
MAEGLNLGQFDALDDGSMARFMLFVWNRSAFNKEEAAVATTHFKSWIGNNTAPKVYSTAKYPDPRKVKGRGKVNQPALESAATAASTREHAESGRARDVASPAAAAADDPSTPFHSIERPRASRDLDSPYITPVEPFATTSDTAMPPPGPSTGTVMYPPSLPKDQSGA